MGESKGFAVPVVTMYDFYTEYCNQEGHKTMLG
jgi:hypothetical protein